VINHARTLILNRNGSPRQDSSFYLEEFVDPSFKKVALPYELQAAHDVLVELDADDAFANFRMQQYMRLLHSTEFASYALALDPRVTYLRPAPPPVLSSVEVVQQLSGATRLTLEFMGAPAVNFASPRVINDWVAESANPNVLSIKHAQTGTNVLPYMNFVDGLSDVVVMPTQANFLLRVHGDVLEPDQRWFIKTFTAPTDDVSDTLLRLLDLNPRFIEAVFPKRAPFTVFKDLWDKNAILAYRMSGFLLAMAYRIQEIRNG
jgi:hypothetical protein